MLPVAVGIGEGSEIQRPLAIAVIGGLTVSTVLTLIIVPSIYYAAYGPDTNRELTGCRRSG
jgi:HAE1 family hydrophobic/amphiphilic exporter-1